MQQYWASSGKTRGLFSLGLPLAFGVALLNLLSALFRSTLILPMLLIRSMQSLPQGQSLPECLPYLRSEPQKPRLHKNTRFHHRENSRYKPLWGETGLLSAPIRQYL